jgi:conjugal transfer ATP-binding protein TraC
MLSLGILKNLFSNHRRKEDDDNVFDLRHGSPSLRDHMAPSLIKELAPGELSGENIKAGDYLVEMGAGTKLVRYFRSFTATMTSATTYAGMLNQLYQADFGDADADIIVHIRPTDSARVLSNLSRLIAGLESDLHTANSTAERERLMDSIMDLREQVRRIRRNIEKMFQVSIQAVVSGNKLEEMDRFSKTLIKRFAGQGVVLRPNDRKQLSALTCATPFDVERVIDHSFRNMESSNIADLFPFGQGGIHHSDGIVIGRDGYNNLVFLDGWHPELLNSHMIIFGRSGAGKSFSIKVITGRSALIGIKTAIIDPDPKQEYLDLVTAFGGSYFSLDAKSKHRINFFDVDIAEDKDGTLLIELEGAINGAQAVILRMVEAIAPQLLEDGLTKILIREKIRDLYNLWDITEDPDSLYETEAAADTPNETFTFGRGKLKKMPTLSDFYSLLQKDVRLEKVAQALKIFTREGNDPTMSIFDCQSTVDIRKDMVFAFSVGNLEKSIMKPLGMFITTEWLIGKFGQQDRLQKKRIIIDESQELLKHPDMADRLEEMFRQMRRYNCSMVAVSQGFEVFMRVPQGLGILKNATIKLLLRQEALDFEDMKDKFDLTDGEMAFLLTTPQGVGLLKIDNLSTVVNIIPTRRELELYNTNPNLIAEMVRKKNKAR